MNNVQAEELVEYVSYADFLNSSNLLTTMD